MATEAQRHRETEDKDEDKDGDEDGGEDDHEYEMATTRRLVGIRWGW